MAETARKKPAERKAEIIRAAVDILAERGPAALSSRAVANAVGISLAAVQYHFKTHGDLVRAMSDAIVNAYAADMEEASQGATPKIRLQKLFEKFATDIGPTDPKIFKLQLHFWSLAHTDPDGKEAFEAYTKQYLERFQSAIKEARPELSDQQVAERALTITSMFEGMVVMALLRLSQEEMKKHDQGFLDAALAIAYS
ncbi:MAG: TetR/AcrR family transcriptional regulator [Henriciella sp.]